VGVHGMGWRVGAHPDAWCRHRCSRAVRVLHGEGGGLGGAAQQTVGRVVRSMLQACRPTGTAVECMRGLGLATWCGAYDVLPGSTTRAYETSMARTNSDTSLLFSHYENTYIIPTPYCDVASSTYTAIKVPSSG
jgi:hypothetical protein